MKIFNQTTGICISQDTKEATSFSNKLLGMLKISNLGGLILKTRFGIHTFFLKKSIDVIVLDNNFNVVKAGTVKPNSLFFWNPKYSLVLELPQGIIKKTKTEIGNHLKILSPFAENRERKLADECEVFSASEGFSSRRSTGRRYPRP